MCTCAYRDINLGLGGFGFWSWWAVGAVFALELFDISLREAFGDCFHDSLFFCQGGAACVPLNREGKVNEGREAG